MGSERSSVPLLSPGQRIEPEIAQQAVVQRVDPGVDGERLAARPGVLHDRRLADVERLFQDVQFAQPIGSAWAPLDAERGDCSRMSCNGRSQLSISPSERRPIAASTPPQP